MAVQVSTLDNGMRVATDHMPHVESATLGVWIGAGTRHEDAANNGVAHLLEHMAFKGTPRRSARAIAEEVEAVGGHINAYTSREHTAYYAKVLKQDTAMVVDILADILQHSVFDEDELARERAVVLQEIHQAYDTPDDIIFDHFQETAFPRQPLGWPVLGRAEVVGAMSRDTLLSYLGDHYRAPHMVFTAAGNVDHDDVARLAETAFSTLPAQQNGARHGAQYTGGELREARPLEQVHLVLGLEGVGLLDDDHHTEMVLSTLLGGGMSSRLFQQIREERGLAYSVYSFTSSYCDGGLFGVYAGTTSDEVQEVTTLICEGLKGVSDGLDEAEVDRARAQLKASVLMALESTTARCEGLGQQLLTYGRPVPPEETVAKIEAVDVAALRKVADRMLNSPPTFTVIGPVDGIEPLDAIAARLA
jgi:predicted Zn-dependent peptidase